ncbi:hypothetical protein L1987_60952 [Smallanthus sonchifolius]|uniref:Uncharacterized protein n=1 Tax=Smallanthus sonchifolius TaxID=185202 RepID=A0ACB9DAE1_9ASTR|nr:hypothetical protein L1987_60952 [Smallanthus sonchifolius]
MVVTGALAFGWAVIELTFKPLIDKARASIDKSDPTRDLDDADVDVVTKKLVDELVTAVEAAATSTGATPYFR